MSDRGFFFGCSVALEKRSSNSLALMMFGSSREPHRVLLLEKKKKKKISIGESFQDVGTGICASKQRLDGAKDFTERGKLQTSQVTLLVKLTVWQKQQRYAVYELGGKNDKV